MTEVEKNPLTGNPALDKMIVEIQENAECVGFGEFIFTGKVQIHDATVKKVQDFEIKEVKKTFK